MTTSEPQPDSSSAQELTTTSPSRSKWIPTPQSFERLLAALDPDGSEPGQHYDRVRRKLLQYFEKRQIFDADRYVDITLDRVMRRLDEGEVIENIMGYIFSVANNVRREAIREQEKMRKASDELERIPDKTQREIDPNERLVCFDECIEKLPIETRVLIYKYYSEDASAKIQVRKQMAQQLGISLGALRNRAHKIRFKLETCIIDCLSHVG